MLGAIIGDIVGSRFEFNNNKSMEFKLFDDSCKITDDSIMTIAIAKAIIECNGNYARLGINAIKYMRNIGVNYPDCGYGLRFEDWIYSDEPKPYNSFGNGSAMRVSPVAYIAKSLEEVKLYSKLVTEVTHNHPEGIKGAEATSVAIWMSLNGYDIKEIKSYIEENYYEINFTIDEIRASYRFNETCQDTVPQALQAFFESKDFEDAIRIAISVGGDSDTLAAITGSIAEAYYSIPTNISKTALEYLDARLSKIFNDFAEKFMKG